MSMSPAKLCRRREYTIAGIWKKNPEDNLLHSIRKNKLESVVDTRFCRAPMIYHSPSPSELKMRELIEGVFAYDEDARIESFADIREWYDQEKEMPVDAVDVIIKKMAIPKLYKYLEKPDYPHLQLDTVWLLSVIASGTSEHRTKILNNGGVPRLVKLLSSPREDLRVQAAIALGYIAADSALYRDVVLVNGALMPLLAHLNLDLSPSTLNILTRTLHDFCSGKPPVAFNLVRHALPDLMLVLRKLVYLNEEEILTDVCWSMFYISDGTSFDLQALFESDVCNRLSDLLLHPSLRVRELALLTVGNIATGDDSQRQILIDGQVLPRLQQLATQSDTKSIQKEACWIISNFTAGNQAQIQAVIEADIVPQLMQLLQHAEYDIKKEAAWAISNATSGGTFDQIRFFVNQGCIKPLCDLLICPDSSIVTACLGGLGNILISGESDKEKDINGGINVYARRIDDLEGFDKIKNLWNHENNEICKKAVKILETYRVKEREEQNLGIANNQPNVPSGGFNQGYNIKPLFDLLNCPDPRIVIVWLEAFENILKVGESDKENGVNGGVNVYAQMIIDDLDGFEKIADLQSHDSNEICEKAGKILEYCHIDVGLSIEPYASGFDWP